MTDLYDFLNTLTPEQRVAFQKAAQDLATERQEAEQEKKADQIKNYSSWELDDLNDQLAKTSPRDKNYSAIRKAHAAKLAGDAPDTRTTMPAADYAALEAKRVELVKEFNSLNSLQGKKMLDARPRLSEIGRELKSLPGNPDRVLEDVKPDAEEDS